MVSLPWLFWEFSLLFSFGTAWSRRRYGRAFRSISLILVVISVLRMAPWFPGFFFQRLVFVLVKDRHPPQISQGRQLHTATKVPRLPADRTVWCGAQTCRRQQQAKKIKEEKKLQPHQCFVWLVGSVGVVVRG